jgi:hypothetical protein
MPITMDWAFAFVIKTSTLTITYVLLVLNVELINKDHQVEYVPALKVSLISMEFVQDVLKVLSGAQQQTDVSLSVVKMQHILQLLKPVSATQDLDFLIMSANHAHKTTSSQTAIVLLAQLTQFIAELIIDVIVQLVSSPIKMEFALENVDKMRFITKGLKDAVA